MLEREVNILPGLKPMLEGGVNILLPLMLVIFTSVSLFNFHISASPLEYNVRRTIRYRNARTILRKLFYYA